MGRVIAKHVPTDYFIAADYARIIDATYHLDDYEERTYDVKKRGVRIRALTELMRWSGLRIRDAVTLECTRLIENKLMLYQAKTGIPVFVLCRLTLRPASLSSSRTEAQPQLFLLKW